jgi:hypothetical protein
MKKMFNTIRSKLQTAVCKVKAAVSNENGAGYIDQAVVILIAVVIGGLLLAALYALFGDIVIPKLQQAITDMFGYSG